MGPAAPVLLPRAGVDELVLSQPLHSGWRAEEEGLKLPQGWISELRPAGPLQSVLPGNRRLAGLGSSMQIFEDHSLMQLWALYRRGLPSLLRNCSGQSRAEPAKLPAFGIHSVLMLLCHSKREIDRPPKPVSHSAA